MKEKLARVPCTGALRLSRLDYDACSAMPKLIYALVASFWAASVVAADPQPPDDTKVVAATKIMGPDSKQIEYDLQHLPWKQFRSVIESVPKMKADVEAYGPAGWKYVEAHYKTYGWKKSIDKLDDDQKLHLSDLVRLAKTAK